MIVSIANAQYPRSKLMEMKAEFLIKIRKMGGEKNEIHNRLRLIHE
jgi:hypothetical protein